MIHEVANEAEKRSDVIGLSRSRPVKNLRDLGLVRLDASCGNVMTEEINLEVEQQGLLERAEEVRSSQSIQNSADISFVFFQHL